MSKLKAAKGGLLAAVQHSGSIGESPRGATPEVASEAENKQPRGKGGPYPSQLLKNLIIRLPPEAHLSLMIEARKKGKTATDVVLDLLNGWFADHSLPQIAKPSKPTR